MFEIKSLSFKCKNIDEKKNIKKGISKSQSKRIRFEEYKKCFDGEEYQKKCNNFIFRSISHEMHLHEIKKSTLSNFDDKRCYTLNKENILSKFMILNKIKKLLHFNRLKLSYFH